MQVANGNLMEKIVKSNSELRIAIADARGDSNSRIKFLNWQVGILLTGASLVCIICTQHFSFTTNLC